MAQRAPFPYDPDTFDQDTRISFSKQTKNFLLEDEQGEEWEWLPGPAKWSKLMDEQLVQQQAEIYKVAGVDDQEPAVNPAKKRKEAQLEDPDTNPKNAKAKAKSAAMPRENTAIYVTGLPLDVDSDEVRDYFSKFGMIAESVDTGDKRVKLYYDSEGDLTGAALVVYHRSESVGQAILLADQAEFPREYGAPTSRISVVEADREYKAQKDDTVAEERSKAGAKKVGAKSAADKAKSKKKAEEMNRRLAEWSDDEPSAMPQTSSRWDKVVVVKRVFTLQELKEDPHFIEDATVDMTEGAEVFGTVKNVTFFDQEEDGVVTIRFSDAMAAKACVNTFDGKSWSGRPLEASIATGEERFKKTRKIHNAEDDEAKRLENFSNFIEGKEDASNGDAQS